MKDPFTDPFMLLLGGLGYALILWAMLRLFTA